MNTNHVKLIVSNNFNNQGAKNSPSRKLSKPSLKYPTCQWCRSSKISLVPVSSIVNLKLGEAPRYQKLWQRQGWPTNRYLCWLCKQNCELAWQGINVWLCPECRKCLVYLKELINSNQKIAAYSQLPTNCSCGWKKKHLTKLEQKRMVEQAIKSRLDYVKGQSYLAQCNFCEGKIVGKQKDKGVKNRNQVWFWSEKVSEERLICNQCLRENEEFLKLLLGKYRDRWRRYKNRGQI